MTKEELIRLWQDDRNWRGGLYRCQEDPRVIVPKRTTWGGWTVNFAHPMAWPAILASVVIAAGPTMGLVALGVQEPKWILAAIVLSIAILIGGSYYLSGRTHPEAVPKIIVLVYAILGVGLWGCGRGMPWLGAAVPLIVIAYWWINRQRTGTK